MAKVLIKFRSRVNMRDYFKRTPLNVAVRSGNIRIVKLLLAHNALPSMQSLNGQSCIDLGREQLSDFHYKE